MPRIGSGEDGEALPAGVWGEPGDDEGAALCVPAAFGEAAGRTARGRWGAREGTASARGLVWPAAGPVVTVWSSPANRAPRADSGGRKKRQRKKSKKEERT